MAMGNVSDEEFERALNNIKGSHSADLVDDPDVIKKDQSIELPIVNGEIAESPSGGRSGGDNNVPSAMRALIGETAVLEGRRAALQLASSFNISPSSVSAYSNGATSTQSYNKADEKIVNHVEKQKKHISGRARNVLKRALNSITDEKLEEAKPRDLSGIAKDMSAIIRDLEPQVINPFDNGGSNSGPSILIYAPQVRTENSFDYITINE